MLVMDKKHPVTAATLGEHRFWLLLWIMSLVVVFCTYLNPLFFENIPWGIFCRDVQGIMNLHFSSQRFWQSVVVPHCFFSGYTLTMLVQVGRSRFDRFRRAIRFFSVVVLYLILIELIQVLVPGRTISGGDILIHLIAYGAGILMGVVLLNYIKFTEHSLHFPWKCIVGWLFVLVYLSIYPIELRAEAKGSLTKVFLHSVAEFPAKSDMLANILLGMPIALLYLAGNRDLKDPISHHPRNWRAILGITSMVLGAAMFVETMQYFFDQRHPSLYDVVFQGLGSALAIGICAYYSVDCRRLLLEFIGFLGYLKKSHVGLLAFAIGFLVFEWTPWFPSIEISAIKHGLRDLVLPLTPVEYPWDLHWEASKWNALFVFLASLLTGVAWYIVLKGSQKKIMADSFLYNSASFYGLFVELGKVIVSTKNATPILVIATLIAGLLVRVSIAILERRGRPEANLNSGGIQ
jgi:VanZ family protein